MENWWRLTMPSATASKVLALQQEKLVLGKLWDRTKGGVRDTEALPVWVRGHTPVPWLILAGQASLTLCWRQVKGPLSFEEDHSLREGSSNLKSQTADHSFDSHRGLFWIHAVGVGLAHTFLSTWKATFPQLCLVNFLLPDLASLMRQSPTICLPDIINLGNRILDSCLSQL